MQAIKSDTGMYNFVLPPTKRVVVGTAVNQLSGGRKARVQFAPKVSMVDHPTDSGQSLNGDDQYLSSKFKIV